MKIMKFFEYFNFVIGGILSGHAAKSGDYLWAAALFIGALINGSWALSYDKRGLEE